MRDVFAAFNRSDFDEAEHLARRLSARLYEPREAEALAELSAGYAAWDRFSFVVARERLSTAARIITEFAGIGKRGWAENVRSVLTGNLQALETLANLTKTPASIEEGLALVIWYLVATERMADVEKTSLAVLLLYAAMERYMGLCLRIEYGLDDDHPDYSRVKDKIDWTRFDDAGRALVGKGYRRRELEGPLMFTNSAQLLATLAPNRLDAGDFGRLQGLSSTRNKCEYEHGFLPNPPAKKDAQAFLSGVKKIVGRCCGETRLEEMLHSYRFPRIRK